MALDREKKEDLEHRLSWSARKDFITIFGRPLQGNRPT
jgi:hypothetical protein